MAFTIEVHGLNQLLGELRKYEPTMYKQIRDELLAGARPLTTNVGSAYPAKPLKYWHSSNERRGDARMPPYVQSKAAKGVRAVVSTSGKKSGILRIEQKDAGGQVYDAAGSKSWSWFVANLDKSSSTRSRPPKTRSRLLYTSVAANMDLVEEQVLQAIRKTDKMIETRIVRSY